MKLKNLFAYKKPLITGLLTAWVLTGCGQTPRVFAPHQNYYPLPLQTLRAAGTRTPSTQGAGIQVSFVKAYGKTIAENEQVTRRDTQGPGAMLIQMIDAARQTLDGALNSGPSGPPRVAITALKQAGIPVVNDQRSGIMHHKFLVADRQAVWTGSTNLTDSSLFHHNNNALVLRSERLAASYQAEFERLFSQRVFGPNPPRQVPFPRVQIAGSTVDVYKTAGEIIATKQRQKVQIEGVFDSWLGTGQYSLFNPLKMDGLNVGKYGNEALLHHKVIIVDDTVITGSYNYSANAENSNNENFLIIRNNSALTQAYLEEFRRIQGISRAGKVRPDFK